MTAIDILLAFPRAFENTDRSITLDGFTVWHDDADASNAGWVVTLGDGSSRDLFVWAIADSGGREDFEATYTLLDYSA